MAEHNGLTFAPVLVKDLNAVFCCNRAHVTSFLAVVVVPRGYPNLRKSIRSSGATIAVIPSEMSLFMVKSAATIALVHGAWPDGSSWNKVIPLLLAKNMRVIAVQMPLTSNYA
jgi:hypothetical protein